MTHQDALQRVIIELRKKRDACRAEMYRLTHLGRGPGDRRYDLMKHHEESFDTAMDIAILHDFAASGIDAELTPATTQQPARTIKTTLLDGTTQKGFLVHGVAYV